MPSKRRALPAAAILLALAACAHNPTPASTPPPPQVTVAASVNALANALDLAVTAMIEARKQGKLSQADLTAANQVAAAIALAGKRIGAELRSADDWQTQQAKILAIVVGAGVRQGAAALPAAATAILQASVAIWNQIAASVGGPAI